MGIFLFATASKAALEPTQSPIQCAPGDLSLGVKRPGHEAENSRPLVSMLRKRGFITPLPNTPSWSGAQLKEKHGNNFTFYLFYYTKE
jgi:hypothetical protein